METKTEHFYNHFNQDRPTGFGNWLVEKISKKIFGYAELKPGFEVLEIGPGRGIFADICLQQQIIYTAIEANKEMTDVLKKKGIEVIHAVVPPLPQINKNFDCAVMIHVIEHVDTMQNAMQTARQINEVLKPGGKLIICSPDYLNLRHNFFNCDFSHNYVTTFRRLEQLLISAGFANIKGRYLCGPITGIMCLVISALAARLPFGLLNSWLPKNKLFQKLYKLQLTFSRNILIVGEKC